jgi:hypothetical protein
MINLDILQWHPRPDVWLDAKDTWIAFPNGYQCHLIYRESTKDSWGWQVTVVKDGMLVGFPMQHHDPCVIDAILRQVETGKLFQHLDKGKHMEELLAAEESLGVDRHELLRDVERDRNILQALHETPRETFRYIDKMVAKGKDPANT